MDLHKRRADDLGDGSGGLALQPRALESFVCYFQRD